MPTEDQQSEARMRGTALAIAAMLEATKIPANEVPVILGILLVALSGQTKVPVGALCYMVTKAAKCFDCQQSKPTHEASPSLN